MILKSLSSQINNLIFDFRTLKCRISYSVNIRSNFTKRVKSKIKLTYKNNKIDFHLL